MTNIADQRLKAKIDALEEGVKAIAERLDQIDKAYQDLPAEARSQLRFDHEALDNLSWMSFKNGKGAWIFSDRALDLKRALLERGSIEIGSFRYKLSGDQDKFITRFRK